MPAVWKARYAARLIPKSLSLRDCPICGEAQLQLIARDVSMAEIYPADAQVQRTSKLG